MCPGAVPGDNQGLRPPPGRKSAWVDRMHLGQPDLYVVSKFEVRGRRMAEGRRGGHPVLVPAGMARCPPVSRHTPSRRSRPMALPFCAAVPAAVPDQPGANRGPLCRQPLLHPGLCVRLLWWVLAHLGGQPSWSQAGQRHEGSARPGQPGRQSAHAPTMHARGFAGAVRRVQGGTEAVGWIRGLPAGQLRTNAEPASLQYTCGISSSRLLFLRP